MNHRQSITLLLTLTFAAPLFADDLPSPAEIHKLADAGQYAAALRQAQRIIMLTGPAAAAFDRYDILMLKSECELQIRQQGVALATLALAKRSIRRAEARPCRRPHRPRRAHSKFQVVSIHREGCRQQADPAP